MKLWVISIAGCANWNWALPFDHHSQRQAADFDVVAIEHA